LTFNQPNQAMPGCFEREITMRRRSVLLGLSALPVLAACQSVNVQQTTTVNAVVETVDPSTRSLLLRGGGGAQSGMLLSMIVSPQVRRLAEIRPGDRVTVTYYQALAAQVVNVLSPTSQPFEGVTVDRRDQAQRPGGEVTEVRRGRVVITAVDPSTYTVSFVGPNKILRTVTAQNPQVQALVRTLHVGDQVDIVYEEALAVSVEPIK
jgi:regulator of extracellular matrix RemA (YlzA/DUF370 family)